MRPLEISLLLVQLPTLIGLLLPARFRSDWLFLFPGLAALLAIAHLIHEGYRWQMVPAYLLTGLLLLLIGRFWLPSTGSPPAGWPISLAAGVGLLWLLVAAAIPIAVPVPKLPPPTGPYAVGTTTFYFKDLDRPEIYSDNPDDHREIMVQIWYPAQPNATDRRTPYIDNLEIFTPAIAHRFNFPAFFMSHLELAQTHAYIDSPVAEAPAGFPILFFSSGWSGLRVQNTFQMEELASHGYIVISADYSYDSIAIVLPNDRIIFNNSSVIFPEGEPTAQRGQLLVDERTKDHLFILEQLLAFNEDPDSHFFGKIDFERMGALGHSTGGATAVEFCAREVRCLAVLSLDGWLEAVSDKVQAAGLPQPTMFINSEAWLGPENRSAGQAFYRQTAVPTFQVTIAGTGHYNFSDIPLISPLAPQMGLAGPINGRHGLDLINSYTLAFFEHYLKDQPASLLNGSTATDPAVTFESRQ